MAASAPSGVFPVSEAIDSLRGDQEFKPTREALSFNVDVATREWNQLPIVSTMLNMILRRIAIEEDPRGSNIYRSTVQQYDIRNTKTWTSVFDSLLNGDDEVAFLVDRPEIGCLTG